MFKIIFFSHQNFRLATALYLRVLPEANEADNYEANAAAGKFNEQTKWFYNRVEVGKTGQIKRSLKQFYNSNKDCVTREKSCVLRNGMCFLISLQDESSELEPAVLSFLEEGRILGEGMQNPFGPGVQNPYDLRRAGNAMHQALVELAPRRP